MVRFAVPSGSADALAAALGELEANGLRVVIATGTASAPPAGSRMLRLELVGLDRPGIIRDISRALADAHVSIDELDTAVVSGAMSGEAMFQANALLRVPRELSTEALRHVLEGLANELMVDIALADSGA
jgi:glycine cleavage system regulatory protein